MSYLVRRLQEQRASAWEQAKALLDAAEGEKRDLTAEEDAQFTKISQDIDAIDVRAKELAEAEERREAGEKALSDLLAKDVAPEARGKVDADANDELRRFFRGETGSRAMELRAVTQLVAGTATAGGNTVPEQFVARLVEHMVEHSGVLAAGPNVISTSGGEDLVIPKTTAHGAKAAIVAEGGALQSGDPTFGQIVMKAYKYGKLLQVSRELIEDTGVDLLGYLTRDAGVALGEGVGEHLLTGDNSDKPQGVLTASTAGKTAAAVAAITPEELIDLLYSVIAPYRRNGKFLVNDSTIASLRKLREDGATGQFLWQPGLTTGAPDTLLGRPVLTDPNMPTLAASAKAVLFGDFSTYTVRRVSSVRLERSDDYAFNTDLVTWRVLGRFDGRQVDTTGAIKHLVMDDGV